MKSIGKFIFRGLEKKDGGEFTNDKGQNIKYDSSYSLKLDEITDDGIYERKLKVDIKNTSLIDRLKNVKPYSEISLECEIVLYGSQAKVVPVNLIDSNNK